MNFNLKNGLDIPITGAPNQVIEQGKPIKHVALLGLDYIDLKPSMAVRIGDQVAAGQLLFTDKKNPGIKITAPVCGKIIAIHRGERRKFESIVIQREGDNQLTFTSTDKDPNQQSDQKAIKILLIDSGLWTSLRTRPYGKIASPSSTPSSIFVTAMDTLPLAAAPEIIINEARSDFLSGLKIIQTLGPKTYLCSSQKVIIPGEKLQGITSCKFEGPHPAGLPSTHIHFVDPVGPGKEVWHIGYQDVIAIGSFFRTGQIPSTQIVALCGPAVNNPRLIKTIRGAAINEICHDEVIQDNSRILSGSALTGHQASGSKGYLGRYHQQVCALPIENGAGFLSWLRLGADRFSSLPIFLSGITGSVSQKNKTPMSTATWGGRRAIFPLGTYEKMIPLNIIATSLLKSVATGNTEKAAELGCLELVEEDLALCSFVCPGKNNFGPMLRTVLRKIEQDG
ncbi:MAG: Na(+)-translocating NADH-quinone reductase subunit A [Desulfobulbaceae bacterium]|nr:Na(+)-translocating NADH-quinone reductase subunit A [Desulfobulbaceae bacterium]